MFLNSSAVSPINVSSVFTNSVPACVSSCQYVLQILLTVCSTPTPSRTIFCLPPVSVPAAPPLSVAQLLCPHLQFQTTLPFSVPSSSQCVPTPMLWLTAFAGSAGSRGSSFGWCPLQLNYESLPLWPPFLFNIGIHLCWFLLMHPEFFWPILCRYNYFLIYYWELCFLLFIKGLKISYGTIWLYIYDLFININWLNPIFMNTNG